MVSGWALAPSLACYYPILVFLDDVLAEECIPSIAKRNYDSMFSGSGPGSIPGVVLADLRRVLFLLMVFL